MLPGCNRAKDAGWTIFTVATVFWCVRRDSLWMYSPEANFFSGNLMDSSSVLLELFSSNYTFIRLTSLFFVSFGYASIAGRINSFIIEVFHFIPNEMNISG